MYSILGACILNYQVHGGGEIKCHFTVILFYSVHFKISATLKNYSVQMKLNFVLKSNV